MQTKYDAMTEVPFDEVSHLDDGILYKASLSEETLLSETGWGLGYDGTTWKNVVGATYTFENGGFKETSADYLRIILPTAAGKKDAIRQKLATRGSVQFQLLLSDLIAFTDTTDRNIMQTVNSLSSLTIGMMLRLVYIAPGTSGYRVYTTSADGVSQFTSPVSLNFGTSANIDNTAGNVVVHADTPTDTDGYITITISWDGRFAWANLNGAPVAHWAHDNGGIQVAAQYLDYVNEFYFMQGSTTLQITMRNLLIMDRPRPCHAYHGSYPQPLRIACVSHSYGTKCEALPPYDVAGKIGTIGQSGLESMAAVLYQELDENRFTWLPFATSSATFADIADRIQDNGVKYHVRAETDAYLEAAATNYINCVARHRPHFCVVYGVGNSSAASQVSLETDVAEINAYLVDIGCIPIYLIEQNFNNPAAVGGNDHSAAVGYVIAKATTERVLYGDTGVGIANGYALLGGASCPNKYMFYDGSNYYHQNLKSEKVLGQVLAAEINRIYRNPPTWSRLWKDMYGV